MDDYRDAIASCCRQLRLSANLADNALAIQGESHVFCKHFFRKNAD